MTREQLRDVILHLLQEIPPETEVRSLSPDNRLRDTLQLDAFDFLNSIIAVHETLRVDGALHGRAPRTYPKATIRSSQRWAAASTTSPGHAGSALRTRGP
jgi:hypothetical protein